MGPSRNELAESERFLRRYDKALRLRRSLEIPGTILLERKVRPGRIGACLKSGEPYPPDAGYRAEWGYVNVGAIPEYKFDSRILLDSLKQADSWKLPRPLWYYEEERDATAKDRARLRRQDAIRYKAENLWNNYVWTYRQRVSVPVQIS
jgi:hypothetical protein